MRAVISAMNGQEARGLKELERAVQLDPALKADAEAIRRRIAPQ